MNNRVVNAVFREGDEVVLAEGSYHIRAPWVFLFGSETTSSGPTSGSAMAASAATRWNGWTIPQARCAIPRTERDDFYRLNNEWRLTAS